MIHGVLGGLFQAPGVMGGSPTVMSLSELKKLVALAVCHGCVVEGLASKVGTSCCGVATTFAAALEALLQFSH